MEANYGIVPSQGWQGEGRETEESAFCSMAFARPAAARLTFQPSAADKGCEHGNTGLSIGISKSSVGQERAVASRIAVFGSVPLNHFHLSETNPDETIFDD